MIDKWNKISKQCDYTSRSGGLKLFVLVWIRIVSHTAQESQKNVFKDSLCHILCHLWHLGAVLQSSSLLYTNKQRHVAVFSTFTFYITFCSTKCTKQSIWCRMNYFKWVIDYQKWSCLLFLSICDVRWTKQVQILSTQVSRLIWLHCAVSLSLSCVWSLAEPGWLSLLKGGGIIVFS